MKKNALLLFTALLTFSCMNEDDFPQIENITKGKKWTLEINSSPSEVYEQLQELGIEKQFNTVAIAYRQPFTKPEDINSDISLYNSITLETTSGNLERILITFDQDVVNTIEKGGAILEPIQSWPENQTDISINVADPVNHIMGKLIALYQISNYQNYQLILPDKSLGKPYDPEMKNFEEWAFTFSKNISSSKDGRNSVRLYFKNQKLFQIRNEYEEFEFTN